MKAKSPHLSVRALLVLYGGSYRTRTYGPLIKSQLLYQLS